MTQVTVRKVEEEWIVKAKHLAAEQGVSMNTVLRNIIAKGLEVDVNTQTNGLEKFAGTMKFGSPEEEREWEQFLDVELNQTDKEGW